LADFSLSGNGKRRATEKNRERPPTSGKQLWSGAQGGKPDCGCQGETVERGFLNQRRTIGALAVGGWGEKSVNLSSDKRRDIGLRREKGSTWKKKIRGELRI